MWQDLYNNADIERTTPINMDPIEGIPLRLAIKLLLEAVSGGFVELDFTVEDNVIIIATKGHLQKRLETKAHDITDIVGQPRI